MTLTPRGHNRGVELDADRLIPGRPSWLLGIVAAVLVFLAVLALAMAVAADQASERWAGGVAQTATLSVIAEEAEIESQARAALAVLRETPGVNEVRVLEPAEQRALLAPYLGTGIAFDAATLPLMMQVETDRAVLDLSVLDARLAAEAPGAVFDDHSAWREPLAAAAARQRSLACLAAALLLLALSGVAVIAARSGAAAASGTIRVLKGLGMPDSRVRSLLVARLARAIAAGGLAGALAATGIAGGIEPDPAAAGFGLGFTGWTWALPALALGVGLVVALIAAAFATDRMLRQWP